MKHFLLTIALVMTSAMAFSAEKICFGIGDNKGERLLLNATEEILSIKALTKLGNAKSGDFVSTGHIVHSVSGINYRQYDGEASSEGDCGTLYFQIDEALLSDEGKGKFKVVCKSNTESYFCRNSVL